MLLAMYNLIEYSDNYSETLAMLWQSCRDELAINDAKINILKRRINWNKYQSKISTEIKKQYLDYLIDLSF